MAQKNDYYFEAVIGVSEVSLKHNRNVTLETIEWLCDILDCQVQDVVQYKKNE